MGTLPPSSSNVENDRRRESAESEYAAVSAAIHTVCWPAMVGSAYLIGPVKLLSGSRDEVLFAVFASVYLSFIVGCMIGTFSHSVVRLKGRLAAIRMAIAIALIFDFTLWGWAVVLMSPKN
ncbi:MAG: hypothetical protein JWP89_5108 [Schlesneria sp.]|nr:hypothetical protein [Schlesneria sp.]